MPLMHVALLLGPIQRRCQRRLLLPLSFLAAQHAWLPPNLTIDVKIKPKQVLRRLVVFDV